MITAPFANEIGGERREPLLSVVSPTEFDRRVAAIYKAPLL
jgi:hypothetical protein